MYQVLVVDDDKLARKGLISIVSWEKCGLSVVGDVSNGMIALEFLKTHAVDLVVVDLSMPVLSGLDFMRESQKDWPNLQYVVLSFHEGFEYVQSALRLGALDYISKLRLEQEDCSQIFLRVGELLEKKLGSANENSVAKGELELSDTGLSKLRAVWCSLTWLYDDQCFQNNKTKLLESGISLRQMERLMVWLSQSLENDFHVTVQLPSFRHLAAGLQWITDYREKLYEDFSEQRQSPLMPVSVFCAVCYVKKHLCDSLKAEMVAEKINMSRGYFSTNFKKITGYTFNDFVRHERVQRAKTLLKDRHIPIAEIAEMVGYEDGKYFSHIFTEQEGVNCSEYRKQMSSQK